MNLCSWTHVVPVTGTCIFAPIVNLWVFQPHAMVHWLGQWRFVFVLQPHIRKMVQTKGSRAAFFE